MANIGKLSAVITADANPFLKGASAAAAGASMAASKIGSAAKSISSSLSIAAVGFGGLATVATGALALAMRSVATDLIATDNAARKVGVSILDYRAAAIWAGAASTEFAGALSVLQNKLDATGVDSLSVASDLESLAVLSGTTSAALREGGWASIVDSLAKIESPTVRAAQAFRLLGSNASGVLAELERGGASATKDMAGRLGLGASSKEVASIRMIDRAFRDLLAVRDGAINQVVLGLAPIGAELTKLFSEVKLNLTFIKPLVFSIVENVSMFAVKMGALVSDSDLLAASLSVVENKAIQIGLSFKATMLEAIADIQQAFNPLAGAFRNFVANGAAGATAFGQGLRSASSGPLGLLGMGGQANEMPDAARDAFARLTRVADQMQGGGLRERALLAGQKSKEFGDEAGLQMNWINNRLLRKKVVQDTQAFFFNARKRMDESPGGLGMLWRAGSGLVDAINKPFSASAVNELQGRFNASRAAAQSPAMAFTEQIRDIRDMKDAGLFAGQEKLQGLFTFQALAKLRQGLNVPAVAPLAGSAEAGSRDAYSAAVNYRQLGRSEKPLDEMKRLLQFANQQRTRQEEIGRQLIDAVKELGMVDGMRID